MSAIAEVLAPPLDMQRRTIAEETRALDLDVTLCGKEDHQGVFQNEEE
ncbi:hypothetical protein [Microtetraspora malaysiensis]|nr:hypothetical protein [Microtetraspora malaysiensis]